MCLQIAAIYMPRPSHLQIPGGSKMASAALARRDVDGPQVSKWNVR